MADEHSEYDVESLRVTREEAREVLDQQTDAITEIHDKGVHVLRFNVLLLGVVLTLASILASSNATPGVGRLANSFVVAGVLASVASMAAAVRTYSNTSFRAGTDASDIRAFLHRTPPTDEWLAALLYNYAIWIEQNALANRRNAVSLFVSHVLLFLSIAYYASGVVYGIYFGKSPWWLTSLVAVCIVFVVGSLLFVLDSVLGWRLFGRVENRT